MFPPKWELAFTLAQGQGFNKSPRDRGTQPKPLL